MEYSDYYLMEIIRKTNCYTHYKRIMDSYLQYNNVNETLKVYDAKIEFFNKLLDNLQKKEQD